MSEKVKLTLCDPHNSIIHQYGIESGCSLGAAVCKKGCTQNSHLIKYTKH